MGSKINPCTSAREIYVLCTCVCVLGCLVTCSAVRISVHVFTYCVCSVHKQPEVKVHGSVLVLTFSRSTHHVAIVYRLSYAEVHLRVLLVCEEMLPDVMLLHMIKQSVRTLEPTFGTQLTHVRPCCHLLHFSNCLSHFSCRPFEHAFPFRSILRRPEDGLVGVDLSTKHIQELVSHICDIVTTSAQVQQGSLEQVVSGPPGQQKEHGLVFI
jgi:hypothetical protein